MIPSAIELNYAIYTCGYPVTLLCGDSSCCAVERS